MIYIEKVIGNVITKVFPHARHCWHCQKQEGRTMFVWAQRVLHGSEERGPECPLRSGIWGSCLLETV